MKYNWIDCLMPFPFDRLDSPFIQNVAYEFKWTFQTIKSLINEISSIAFCFRDQRKYEKDFFSLLDAEEF